jgi:hypothetical protein
MSGRPFTINNKDAEWDCFCKVLDGLKAECGASVETFRSCLSDGYGTRIEVRVCLPEGAAGKYATIFRLKFL